MKAFSILLSFVFLSFSISAKSLELGSSIPKLDEKISQMQATDGKIYTIESVKKPAGTLVIFSCNSCPYVVKWEKRIAMIGNTYSKEWTDESTNKKYPGIGVIMINSNDPKASPKDGMDEMIKRAKSLGLEFPYAVDSSSQIAKAFGASRTPEVFLFDKDGKLVYKGAVDDNHNEADMKETYLINAIQKMLKGEPIERKETKAIGCMIKFRS